MGPQPRPQIKPQLRYSGKVKVSICIDDSDYICDVQQGSDGSTVTIPIGFLNEDNFFDPQNLDEIAKNAITYARVAEPGTYSGTCEDSLGNIHIGRFENRAWFS